MSTPRALFQVAVLSLGVLLVTGCGPDDGDTEESWESEEQAVSTCRARTTVGGYPVYVNFTNPAAPCRPKPDGFDNEILHELKRLIDRTPRGATIRGNVANFSSLEIAQSLVRAQGRGVQVYLTGDGKLADKRNEAMAEVNKIAYRRWCKNRNAAGVETTGCLGNNGFAHLKMFTFTATSKPGETRATSRVTWFSSQNPTTLNWTNNSVTIYGDAAAFNGANKVHSDMFTQANRTADYFDRRSGRGYFKAPSATFFVSPELQTDLIVTALNDITPSPECRIRVMHASVKDSRLSVVDKLVRLKQGKCQIQVVTHLLHPEARRRLENAGIPIRLHKVHDKNFVVYAKYGTQFRHVVYTGSHNLSGSANSNADELFVRMDGQPLHDAFYRHFMDAYRRGVPPPPP